MRHHPLFPITATPGNNTRPRLLRNVRVEDCRVSDFLLGMIRIEQSPHFLLARDIVSGMSTQSSGALYRLYRKSQFSFNQEQSLVDEKYFRDKVLAPDFDLALTAVKMGGRYLVLDGFHRLAIAAAHDVKTVLIEASK